MLHVVGKPLWRPTSNQHLPMLTTLIPSRLSLKLPVSCSAPRHLRERIFLCSRGLVQAAAAWADERACAAPCSFRELQTRTAVKIQGRGKKKIQLSALQLGKHSNDMEEEDDEDMPPPHSEDKETRDESETKALRAQDWAVQLASLSPSQLHLAKRLVHWLFLLLTQGTKDRHWSVEKQLWNLVRLKVKLSHWFGIANLQSEWT
jgi:hypothetical protein